MPNQPRFVRPFLCCILLATSWLLTAQYSMAPSLQIHTGLSRFWPASNSGENIFSEDEFRRINAWATGLAFQKPLRYKLAFQASLYYLESKDRYKESYWYQFEHSGIDLDEDITSAPHFTQMALLNMQIYFQQHGFSQETVELGLGFVGSLNRQKYRSDFDFNEQLLQFNTQEFTTREDLDIGVSMNVRVSFRLRERWRLGLGAGGIFFFDGDQLFILALSTHYRLRP